jgi:hypothetical protein
LIRPTPIEPAQERDQNLLESRSLSSGNSGQFCDTPRRLLRADGEEDTRFQEDNAEPASRIEEGVIGHRQPPRSCCGVTVPERQRGCCDSPGALVASGKGSDSDAGSGRLSALE